MGLAIVDVVNDALASLGEQPIVNLDKNNATSTAILIRQKYPLVLQSLLMEADWNCARFTTKLARISANGYGGYKYVFQLPTDPECLHVVQISLDGGQTYIDLNAYYNWNSGPKKALFDIDRNFLLCNANPVYIKYTGAVGVSSLDPLVASAFSSMLATELAYAVTASINLYQQLFKESRRKLAKAKSRNALDRNIRRGEGDVIAVRYPLGYSTLHDEGGDTDTDADSDIDIDIDVDSDADSDDDPPTPNKVYYDSATGELVLPGGMLILTYDPVTFTSSLVPLSSPVTISGDLTNDGGSGEGREGGGTGNSYYNPVGYNDFSEYASASDISIDGSYTYDNILYAIKAGGYNTGVDGNIPNPGARVYFHDHWNTDEDAVYSTLNITTNSLAGKRIRMYWTGGIRTGIDKNTWTNLPEVDMRLTVTNRNTGTELGGCSAGMFSTNYSGSGLMDLRFTNLEFTVPDDTSSSQLSLQLTANVSPWGAYASSELAYIDMPQLITRGHTDWHVETTHWDETQNIHASRVGEDGEVMVIIDSSGGEDVIGTIAISENGDVTVEGT